MRSERNVPHPLQCVSESTVPGGVATVAGGVATVPGGVVTVPGGVAYHPLTLRPVRVYFALRSKATQL